jgi:hypothetical protein
MSMEVSVTSEPIPPVATTQVARSTKELLTVKPAEGAFPAPSTVDHSTRDKPAQAKMALPVGANQHRSSPITGGCGTQSGSKPANPVSGPAPNPTSGTESAKKDSASTPTRSDESPASAPNPILNKANENPTPGVGDREDHHETAPADEIKELWSSQKRKDASLTLCMGHHGSSVVIATPSTDYQIPYL